MFGGTHPGAGLSGVKHRLPTKALLERADEPGELPCCLELYLREPADRHVHTQHVADQLRRAFQRQVLTVKQVHRQGAGRGAVTHRRAGFGREAGHGLGPARAPTPIGRMVGHHRGHCRDVDHLAADPAHQFGISQIPAAATTALRAVSDHHIRIASSPVRARRPRLLALRPLRSAEPPLGAPPWTWGPLFDPTTEASKSYSNRVWLSWSDGPRRGLSWSAA